MKAINRNTRKPHAWAALALACTLMMAALSPATAQNPYPPYDFSQANSDGDILYYRITSNTAPYTVAVTRSQDSSYYNLQIPTMTYQEGMPGYLYPLFEYDTLVVIPSTVAHNNITYSVTSVDEKAFFYEKGIRRIELPGTVTTIEDGAFWRSNLNDIVMPNVQNIGEKAFCYTALTHVDLPANLNGLGENAFSHSLLESVDIPSGVGVLSQGCFSGCPLQTITLHEGLLTIEDNAFCCVIMDSLILPSSLQYLGNIGGANYYGEEQYNVCRHVRFQQGNNPLEIGDMAFYSLIRLEDIILPDNVVSLGASCFSRSGLRTIVLPPRVKVVPGECFYHCDSLQSVTLPDSLERIGASAFYGCASLQSVTIPSNVLQIEEMAFLTVGMSNRTFNMMGEIPPALQQKSMGNASRDIILFNIPCETTAAYQAAVGWDQYVGSSTVTFHEICTGVANRETEDIMLYPNPVHHLLTVEIPSGEAATIELYDMFGKLVLSQNAEGTSTDISVANLPAGLYLLQLTFPNGEQATRKVVKD